MKQSVLFVINTLGRAGAENALVELLKLLDYERLEVSCFVLSGQGELAKKLPKQVKLINSKMDETPVLSKRGRRHLAGRLFFRCLQKGIFLRRFGYLFKNACRMAVKGSLSVNLLTRLLLADAAERFDDEYDLAVAYLEGGAAFYVDSYVKAKKKAAFIHVDYGRAGYNRKLDLDTYLHFDRIFAVSDEVKKAFLKVYPECKKNTGVFHNQVNTKRIWRKAGEPGGFTDDYEGFRILTVGRLYAQKALEQSVEAMHILKQRGIEARWYVLGDGEERGRLTNLIRKLRLEQEFLLLGACENPYPYFAQTDLYVHASRFEGKSIAIQEAQVLGCAIILSDCSGNREQVTDGVDGLLCKLGPESIADAVELLYRSPEQRKRLGDNAKAKRQAGADDLKMLYDMLTERGVEDGKS